MDLLELDTYCGAFKDKIGAWKQKIFKSGVVCLYNALELLVGWIQKHEKNSLGGIALILQNLDMRRGREA